MEFPKRKHPRLKQFDYSSGCFFVTICANERKNIFARIVPGTPVLPAEVHLSSLGRIAAEQIEKLGKRFLGVNIDAYVVMPNHLHAIISIQPPATVTLMDVVCAYKSLTARNCRQISNVEKVFQDSFHEHVIRERNEYQKIWEYIQSNPQRWEKDCFFSDKIIDV